MSPELWKLQKVFQWSSSITTRVKKFLKEQFDNEKFVGVHLRRGSDWVSFSLLSVSDYQQKYLGSVVTSTTQHWPFLDSPYYR